MEYQRVLDSARGRYMHTITVNNVMELLLKLFRLFRFVSQEKPSVHEKWCWKGVQQAFQDHGLIANVRLETYEGNYYNNNNNNNNSSSTTLEKIE
jgi:hypothetical protein